jgi:hypothetical protein
MYKVKRIALAGLMAAPLILAAGDAEADDISGAITSTRTILTDSRLVGDVTCTVTGAPCIVFGASRIQLRLNGFTMTGQADPATACSGVITANEHGISTNGQMDAGIRGPGIVQRFRANGILVAGTLRGKVEMVTTTTNCQSGILVNAASSQIQVEANVSVRNGSSSAGAACGGI